MAVREYTNSSFSSFTNAREDGPCIFQQRARARAHTHANRNFSRCPTDGSSFSSLFLFFFPLSFAHHVRSIFYSRREREGTRFPRFTILSFLRLSFLSLSIRTNLRTSRLFSHAFHVMFFLSFRRLKLDCEKLANDKIEIQRHYVMVSAIIVAS